MDYTRFGSTGLSVSRLCLGTMTFGFQCDEPTSVAIMDRAFDGGVTFVDTADAYPLGGPHDRLGRTEEIVGRWMQRVGRGNVVLATKCFYPTGPNRWDMGNSRQNIMRAVEDSLRRLQTDHIDLYQLHAWDSRTPIDESLKALDDLVHSGKVRYIGSSNFLGYQLARSLGRSEVLRVEKFASVQPRYNLLYREIERELLPACQADNVAVIPYNPLAGGLLSGKHTFESGPTEGTRFTLGAAADRYQNRYWHKSEFETVTDLQDPRCRGRYIAGTTRGVVGAGKPCDHQPDHRSQQTGTTRRVACGRRNTVACRAQGQARRADSALPPSRHHAVATAITRIRAGLSAVRGPCDWLDASPVSSSVRRAC